MYSWEKGPVTSIRGIITRYLHVLLHVFMTFAIPLGTPPILSVGTTVEGKIVKVLSQGLRVVLPCPLPGIVDVTNISDHFFANPLQYFKIGESYRYVVIYMYLVIFSLSLSLSSVSTYLKLQQPKSSFHFDILILERLHNVYQKLHNILNLIEKY